MPRWRRRTARPTTVPIANRVLRLLAGLVLFGASVGAMASARLGLSSWDVLHQGVAERLGLPLGMVVIGVSVAVVVLWVPLRQRPGVGTLANVVVVGLSVDATLAVLPEPGHMAARVAFLVAGIVVNGLATGLYIGAGLGPGPRDGLMTGLAARGHSVRAVRTSIEASVLVAGWLLGGTVGVGTVLYALTIGALVQFFLHRLAVPTHQQAAGPGGHEERANHGGPAVRTQRLDVGCTGG